MKPERDVSNDDYLRENWWLFRRTNQQLRSAIAGLRRYIGTTETAKHRVFSFVSGDVLPDQKIRVVALDDTPVLGVLSSRLHVCWALAAGGTLEDRPVYNNTTCFEPFPFPCQSADTRSIVERIGAIAEELDALRKRQQAAHAALTLTDMYNVLDALRQGRPLTPKERVTHTNGLVSVLAELHDRIDALVLQAYGWADLAPALVGRPGGTLPWPEKPVAQAEAEEELLLRLVALNAARAAEEACGEVRWLRPEFQDPARRMAPALPALPVSTQDEMALGEVSAGAAQKVGGKPPAPSARRPWPADLPEQVRAIADMLTAAPGALDESALAEGFTGRGPWKKRLPGILLTLEALGRARREGERWRA